MEPLVLLAHKEARVCRDTCQPSTTIMTASAAIAPMAHLVHPANPERSHTNYIIIKLFVFFKVRR